MVLESRSRGYVLIHEFEQTAALINNPIITTELQFIRIKTELAYIGR